MKKLIALITSMSFLIGIAVPGHAVKTGSAPERETLFIPVSYGKITGGKYFGGDEIIINIQDLHCHGEVQRNIAGIIGHLDSSYGLDHVYLEGASGEIDTSLLSNLRKSDIGFATIEKMIDDGYLNGIEYYSAVNNKNKFIKGIENAGLYERNISLLNSIMDSQLSVEAICSDLVREMKPVMREYGDRDAKRLNRLAKKFENKSINSEVFYKALLLMAKKEGIETGKYKNISGYANLTKTGKINTKKVTEEFKLFLEEAKKQMTYKEFSDLSQKSNSFADLETISPELSAIEKKYGIAENRKLNHLKKFFAYLEFNNEVNPMEFAKEEKALKEELYSEYGRNKYESEVLWLSEFIPTIKGYFTANITSEELETFERDFKRFKKSWCLFFSENTAKQLDAYADMLAEYHGNNLKRDQVFADIMGLSGKSFSSAKADKRKFKVVVTGGFHSKGLEKIFEENNISYVVVTPRITKDIKSAGDLYMNIMRGYRSIEKSTINIKPFLAETINEGMPKLIAVTFNTLNTHQELSKLDRKDKLAGLKDFVEDFIKQHETGDLYTKNWNVTKFTEKDMVFEIEYKNKKDDTVAGVKNYAVKKGSLVYSDDESNTENDRGRRNNIELLSAVSGFFKNTNTAAWRIVNVFIVPVIEEIIFRFLPFAGVSTLILTPVSFIPVAFTAIAGAVIFTFVHSAADKLALKINPFAKKRNLKRIFTSTLALSGIYILIAAFVPGGALLGLFITTGVHILNDYLSYLGKIKNPILSILGLSEKSKEEKVSGALDETLNALKEIMVKAEDRFTPEAKKTFTNILNNLEQAKEKELKGKYVTVQEELGRLSDFIKNGDTFKESIRHSSLANDIVEDIFNSIYDISTFVDYSGEQERFSDKLFYDFLEISINTSAGRSGMYNKIMRKIAADKYLLDKEAGLAMIREMYTEREYETNYDGETRKVKYTMENISYRLNDAATYGEVRDAVLSGEWYDLIEDEELLSFVKNIAGREAPKFEKWLKKQERMISGKSINKSEEIAEGLEDLISGLKKTFKDVTSRMERELYLKKTYEEQLSRFERIINDLEKAAEYNNADDKNKAVSELLIEIDALMREFLPHQFANFIAEVYDAVSEVSKYIEIESEDGNILLIEKNLERMLEVVIAESMVTPIKVFEMMTAKAYEADKDLGLRYLQEEYKKRHMTKFGSHMESSIRELPKLKSTDSIENAREELPAGWNAVLSDEEIEDVYDAIGIDYEGPDGKSKKYSRQKVYTDIVGIMSMLPKNISGATNTADIAPAVIRVKKNKDVKQDDDSVGKKFDYYRQLLLDNADALAELNSNHNDSLFYAMGFLEKMIENLGKIERYGIYSGYAEKALKAIKEDLEDGLTPEKIKEHKSVKKWTEMENIKEVHTLINAVHQQAIASFMAVRDGQVDGAYSEVDVNPDDSGKSVKIYNFSNKPLSHGSLEFISLLPGRSELLPATSTKAVLVMKDGIFIWSHKIGVHSVDVMIDLNNPDDGISISYNDSGRGDGNRQRVSFLAAEMAKLGMDITRFDNDGGDKEMPGLCGFQAIYNTSDRANIAADFMEVFEGIIRVMRTSKGLDYKLEGRDDDDADKGYFYGKFKVPKITDADLKNMKSSGWEMPEQFKGTNIEMFWKGKYKDGQIQNRFDSDNSPLRKIEGLNAVYDYLGLEGVKRNEGEVLRMYASGKLIMNEQGTELEVNKAYYPMKNIITAINDNRGEAFAQAQLLNLINYDLMNFVSEGYVGNMLALNGFIRTREGFISVNGLVDRERKRLKCAYAEFVDMNGNRSALEYKDLLKMLKDEGFAVETQQARTSAEKKETMNQLKKNIPSHKSSTEVMGMGISSGEGKYISGKITYDRDKVDGESIWVVGYTTPDDIEKIEQTRGLITTSGGQLSHANISAREKEKPAVLIKERWNGGNIEVRHYIKSGSVRKEQGFDIIQLSEERILLKEGQRVLINGDDGTVLVFDGVAANLLDELQNAVDNADISAVQSILEENIDSEHIDQILEFVYYQIFGKEQYEGLLITLLSRTSPALNSKISDINNNYIMEIKEEIERIIKNMDSITNVNVAYNLLLTAAHLMSTASIGDVNNLLYEIEMKIYALKKQASRERRKFVSKFVESAENLISKEELSVMELEKAVNLSEMAKVWDNFHDFSGVENVVRKLDRTINKARKAAVSAENNFSGLIKDLNDIYAVDALEYGSKTAELAKISRYAKDNGYEDLKVFVPQGVGIGKDIFDLLAPELLSEGLSDEFERAVLSGNANEAKAVAGKIINVIKNVHNTDFKNTVEKFLDTNKKYAVRSSGIGEDGAASAFAGMGKTNLNVNAEDVYKKVLDSWKSFYDFKSVEYMAQNKMLVNPAILVQEMVGNVEKGGVIFSKDKKGDLTIEVAPGLGEGVVSGRIEPDHISIYVDTDRIEYKRAIGNTRKIVSLPEGGITVQNLKAEEKINRILDTDMIEKLASIAQGLDKDSGYPVDIEFAIDADGNVFILQRRPITTFVVEKTDQEIRHILSVKAAANTAGRFSNSDIIMYVEHPSLEGTPVAVYHEKTKGSVSSLIIDNEYANLLGNDVFIAEMTERANHDDVVRKKGINGNINPESRVNAGEIGVEPVLFDSEKAVSEDTKKMPAISLISEMLAAA